MCVLWHPRIRHILTGTTSGETRVLYDPELSTKGALMSVSRDHKPRHFAADTVHLTDGGQIVNPNALPMYRDNDAWAKKKGQYSKLRADSKASKNPDPPLESGQQGRSLGGAKTTFCQTYIEANLRKSIRHDNPRDELLKYADKEPIFNTELTFYTDRAGEKILDTETLEAAETNFIEEQKRLVQKFGGGPKKTAK